MHQNACEIERKSCISLRDQIVNTALERTSLPGCPGMLGEFPKSRWFLVLCTDNNWNLFHGKIMQVTMNARRINESISDFNYGL